MLRCRDSGTPRCEVHIVHVIVHCDKQSLSTSCLAADVVPGLVVFSLQTNCFRVQLESGQDLLLLGDLCSVDLLHIRVQLLRSIVSKQTETRPNHIPILEKKLKPNKQTNKQVTPVDPDVKVPLVISYSSLRGSSSGLRQVKKPLCPVEVVPFFKLSWDWSLSGRIKLHATI